MSRYKTPNTAAAAPETPPYPCPGYHNDPWRYAENPDDNHEHPDNYAHGKPIWCERCTDRLHATLEYLPRLAASLALELEHATDQKPERVSGTRARALHAHQAQALLINEIYDVLTQWEDETRTARGFTPRPRDRRQGAAISAARVFLLAHLDWILTKAPETGDPQGVVRAFIDRVNRIERCGMRLTHQTEARPEPCIGVPCKRCDWRALVRAVDKTGAAIGDVECENCHHRLSAEEYRAWAAQWAAYENAALTDDERAQMAGPVGAYERARGAR